MRASLYYHLATVHGDVNPIQGQSRSWSERLHIDHESKRGFDCKSKLNAFKKVTVRPRRDCDDCGRNYNATALSAHRKICRVRKERRAAAISAGQLPNEGVPVRKVARYFCADCNAGYVNEHGLLAHQLSRCGVKLKGGV